VITILPLGGSGLRLDSWSRYLINHSKSVCNDVSSSFKDMATMTGKVNRIPELVAQKMSDVLKGEAKLHMPTISCFIRSSRTLCTTTRLFRATANRILGNTKKKKAEHHRQRDRIGRNRRRLWRSSRRPTCLRPAVGTIIGGLVEGIVATGVAKRVSDWFTRKIFDLPQSKALENAFRVLSVHHGGYHLGDRRRISQTVLELPSR